MAVEPLYNDKTLMLQRLRMSETTDTDTKVLMDQAIADVRLEFFRRLTLDRAMYIHALPSVENPTTADGVLRSRAEVAEVYWVMYKLVCIMPVMYIETQYAIRNDFNDVPLVRDADSIHDFRRCLKTSVEQMLMLLIVPPGDASLGGGVQTFSTGATAPSLLSNSFIGNGRCR